MKKFLKNNWALIGWILSIALDQQFKIVETLVKNPDSVKLIYGIGSVILAKFWNTNKANKGLLTSDLGGTNPPPNRDEK
ncbi:hypothetical protein U9K52_08440 [Chryseobacterium sp. MHB01]|uniref:hypothetical protein n=1 Tax=Chryseobacterium sp. MHB01 TaxID=3109433 RepID=UPI002AFE9F11|nr:hypothetical protein [Chryseobacterium sp. MHB01]MEA1848936.1 hypothetical protein [Chryseobacterium sp. MHB01]